MKKLAFLITLALSPFAWSEEPELPTDPSDPNYESDLQNYIDYQMKSSRNPAQDDEEEAEAEESKPSKSKSKLSQKTEIHVDGGDELEAMKAKAMKACLDDPQGDECMKYRKLHGEAVKFGLETLDILEEHAEERAKKKAKKKKSEE